MDAPCEQVFNTRSAHDDHGIGMIWPVGTLTRLQLHVRHKTCHPVSANANPGWISEVQDSRNFGTHLERSLAAAGPAYRSL